MDFKLGQDEFLTSSPLWKVIANNIGKALGALKIMHPFLGYPA